MIYSSKTITVRLLWGLWVFVPMFYTLSISAQVQMDHYAPFKYELDEKFSPAKEKRCEQDIEDIIELQQDIHEDDLREMNYWNAAYPSYRWHQILMEISQAQEGHKNGGRVVILHLSIYDALVEVWKHKKANHRQAPFQSHQHVEKLGRQRDYSPFICEWSAAAGAAHQVIGYYFPDRIEYLDTLLEKFIVTRLRTGLQFPSDIEKGLEIGRQIAHQYIAYAKTDRTDQMWEGQVPAADSLWSGDPGKWDPMKGQWRPLTLLKADQFRPSPPPTDWSEDMEELRRFNQTHQSSDIAWKWKSEPIWDNLVERKILEYDLNPLEAAFANAVFHTARFDAIIAAWDAKYHYWGIRPFQFDPEFKSILVDTPNFPGYPAGHTTVAGSIARVLSFLFPQDEKLFHNLAWECSESRFEGGVHFRTDNEVGLKVGNKVGNQVIEAFTKNMP